MGRAKYYFTEVIKIINTYSFSKLSTFHQCKKQYYLNYVLPHDERPPKESNAFAQYGTLCHELLEDFENGKLASYELADKYIDLFDVYVTHKFPPNAYADLYESYFNDGLSFFVNFEGFGDRYKILEVEHGFEEDFGDFILKGFIDLTLMDENTGKIIVVDHKSKSGFKKKELRDHYLYQPLLYAKYIETKFGQWPDILRFHCFRKQKNFDTKFNMADYERAVEWARSTVKEIESCKDWPETYDEFMCSCLCDFRSYCASEKCDE